MRRPQAPWRRAKYGQAPKAVIDAVLSYHGNTNPQKRFLNGGLGPMRSTVDGALRK